MNAENLNEKKQKILIIDDEVEITKALERQFKRKYTVFSANSALEASTIIEKEDIQVIISDQRMPGMTGIEFYNKIKTAYPDTVKIILTGYYSAKKRLSIFDILLFRSFAVGISQRFRNYTFSDFSQPVKD